jgi:hypothetical protein
MASITPAKITIKFISMVLAVCNSISNTKTKNPVGQKLKMLPKQPPEKG